MIYLILLAIISASFAGIFYIVMRKIRNLPQSEEGGLVYPDFKTSPKASQAPIGTYLEKLFNLKEGGGLSIFMEKFFRKNRVRIMRIENLLAEIAERLQKRRLAKEAPKERSGGKNGNNASFIGAHNDEDGKFDEHYWLDVVKQEPQSAYPYKKLGAIYLARGDFREARWALKRAIKLDPADDEIKAKIGGLRGKRTRRGGKP